MILISGATGQVGTDLLAELGAQGLPLRALAHTSASLERLKAQGIAAILAEDTQPAELAAAFAGVERFFLLTGGGPEQAASERRLVDAARQAGVRHIVKQSALGVEEPSVSLFTPHLESEQYIQQSGIGYTILRPNFFMQNLGNLDSAQLKATGSFANSIGAGAVSLVDTRDIAAVAAAALQSDDHIGQIYELTGPEALSYGELAVKLTTVLGKPIAYFELSDDAYQEALVSAGLPDARASGLTELYRFYREGNAATVNDTVSRITGRPARTMDAYLAEHRARFE